MVAENNNGERPKGMTLEFPSEKARQPSKEAPTSEVGIENVQELYGPEIADTPEELFAMLARDGSIESAMVILPTTQVNADGSVTQHVKVLCTGDMTNSDQLWLAEKVRLGALGFDVE
jgi:hypothetical protein